MNQLTVRAKLTWAFGGLTFMVLLIAGLAIKSLGDESQRFKNYVDGINARLNKLQDVRSVVDLRAIAVRNLLLVTKPQDVELEKTTVLKAHADVGVNLDQLNKLAESKDTLDEERRLIGVINKVEQQYAPVALAIVQLELNKEIEAAHIKIVDECRPLLASLEKAADEYARFSNGVSAQLIEAAAADYAAQRNILIVGCVIALLGAVAAGLLIMRSLTRALGGEPAYAAEVARHIAEGNLSMDISTQAGDDTSLLAAMKNMRDSLVRVVGSVREGSESVATASAQIAQGNNDLSARTEQQASALQQTAASMDELSSNVRQNADNARQANELAMSASMVAAKGGEVVSQVVQTMRGINDSSKKIGDIISVIDGIAFQTNILALNAAVEAARAGEQGRGFAVVASEVRSLAGRSAEAAKEIKGLIGASVERVEQGTALVDQAGATMSAVVSSIRGVTELVGGISAASNEQSQGVSQVGEAIAQMDQATQQNAALVEEMAAAATSLKGQAQELVQAVAVFRLEQEGGRVAMVPAGNRSPVLVINR